MSDKQTYCELCGEPMPEGETMFKFHGYSGPCPKPPLPKPVTEIESLRAELTEKDAEIARLRIDARLMQAFCLELDTNRRHRGPMPVQMQIWDAMCDAIGQDCSGDGMRSVINTAIQTKEPTAPQAALAIEPPA